MYLTDPKLVSSFEWGLLENEKRNRLGYFYEWKCGGYCKTVFVHARPSEGNKFAHYIARIEITWEEVENIGELRPYFNNNNVTQAFNGGIFCSS